MRTIGSVLLVPLGLAITVGCQKKTEAPPPVGWHAEELWLGQCYFPPDFDAIEAEGGEYARKSARATALQEMKSQWMGERETAVSFSTNHIDDLETTLLADMTRLESVAQENLSLCKQAMGHEDASMQGPSISKWEGWLRGLPEKLTAGECNTPLDYQLIQYLEVNTGWQQPVAMCQGNRARIEATEKDRYKISSDGEPMNAAGDVSAMAVSADLPCNFEGCYPGMLVGRFVTDAGVETIFPIGLETVFEAPEHGTLTYTINDTTYYDNTWNQTGRVIDKTAITISPE